MSGERSGLGDLTKLIVRALVDHPDDVRVREKETDRIILLELSVREEDVGKVIGKKGLYADAIRKLLSAAGGKHRKRVVFQINEP